MAERIGDAPIDAKYHQLMNQLAQEIDTLFNGPPMIGRERKVGFCLMVYPFGDGPGRCNYISNAKRDDVVTLLAEQLKRFYGIGEIKGGKHEEGKEGDAE